MVGETAQQPSDKIPPKLDLRKSVSLLGKGKPSESSMPVAEEVTAETRPPQKEAFSQPTAPGVPVQPLILKLEAGSRTDRIVIGKTPFMPVSEAQVEADTADAAMAGGGPPPPTPKAPVAVPAQGVQLSAVKLPGETSSVPKFRPVAVPAIQPTLVIQRAAVTPPAAATQVAKKQTSRVALESALGALKVEKTPSPADTEKPKAAETPTQVVSPETAKEAKKQTSRIALESVFGDKATGAAKVPKTIRLKAPSQLLTIKTPRPPEAQPAAAVEDGIMKKTAQIDIAPPEEGQSAQLTKKKTIKIKRAETAYPSERSVEIARQEEELKKVVVDEENPGIFAGVAAIVAVPVVCVLLYLLITQAFPSLGWRWWGQV